MRELLFISAQPSDLYYATEVEVQINNFRKWGYSDKMHILVYEPEEDAARLRYREYWKKLQDKYKEVKIFMYPDKGIRNLTKVYIPVLRPHILAQHFDAYPELKDKAIFYHDADILFAKPLDFTPFLEDDICYISDTKSYINSDYFDSKIQDVKPDKLEAYKNKDVLQEACNLVGITREIAEKNKNVSGGAQYLLKNIDGNFWRKVQNDCISIRLHLVSVNRIYFESEERGFQSWCADMWSVLWNLWALNKETQTPDELSFSWATSPSSEWGKHYIYHNAGVTQDRSISTVDGKKHTLFWKGDPIFKNNILTFFDPEPVEYSDQFCAYYYAKEIEEVVNPVCVTSKVNV